MGKIKYARITPTQTTVEFTVLRLVQHCCPRVLVLVLRYAVLLLALITGLSLRLEVCCVTAGLDHGS